MPDTLIFRTFHKDRIDFRVEDYRTNYSTRFSVDVDAKIRDDFEVFFCSFLDVEVSL